MNPVCHIPQASGRRSPGGELPVVPGDILRQLHGPAARHSCTAGAHADIRHVQVSIPIKPAL